MLRIFLQETGQAFIPYIEHTSKVLHNVLYSGASSSLRVCCVEAFPTLIQILKDTKLDGNDVVRMGKSVVDTLLNASKRERDPGVIKEYIFAIYFILESVGKGFF